MANFKQFEYIFGQPNGIGQINSVTGSQYQVTWLQLRNNFQTINPQPAAMSPNYPIPPSSNTVVVRPQPLQKVESLVQWVVIADIDANYTSQGFDFVKIRTTYLDNKGYTNDQEPPK
jgi:hypothetical protein